MVGADPRGGRRTPLMEFFYMHYEALCGFIETQIRAPEVAEDLAQDLFLDLWQRRHSIEVRTSLRAYLFGAARNLALKHRERRNVRHQWKRGKKADKEPVDKSSTAISPDEHVIRQDLVRALKASVADLPERRQMVYRLSRQYGLTYREIATVMEISPKTVENQMISALKFLRERLQTYRTVED